jgi:hypothetical protein
MAVDNTEAGPSGAAVYMETSEEGSKNENREEDEEEEEANEMDINQTLRD